MQHDGASSLWSLSLWSEKVGRNCEHQRKNVEKTEKTEYENKCTCNDSKWLSKQGKNNNCSMYVDVQYCHHVDQNTNAKYKWLCILVEGNIKGTDLCTFPMY